MLNNGLFVVSTKWWREVFKVWCATKLILGFKMIASPVKPDLDIEDCPILGLDSNWPDTIYVIRVPPSKYIVEVFKDGQHLLVCFIGTSFAQDYIATKKFDKDYAFKIEEVTFDEAIDIAKGKPNVSGLVLYPDGLTYYFR